MGAWLSRFLPNVLAAAMESAKWPYGRLSAGNDASVKKMDAVERSGVEVGEPSGQHASASRLLDLPTNPHGEPKKAKRIPLGAYVEFDVRVSSI